MNNNDTKSNPCDILTFETGTRPVAAITTDSARTLRERVVQAYHEKPHRFHALAVIAYAVFGVLALTIQLPRIPGTSIDPINILLPFAILSAVRWRTMVSLAIMVSPVLFMIIPGSLLSGSFDLSAATLGMVLCAVTITAFPVLTLKYLKRTIIIIRVNALFMLVFLASILAYTYVLNEKYFDDTFVREAMASFLTLQMLFAAVAAILIATRAKIDVKRRYALAAGIYVFSMCLGGILRLAGMPGF